MEGWKPCPKCKLTTVPKLVGNEFGAVCQNPECRVEFNEDEIPIGYWTENYATHIDLRF